MIKTKLIFVDGITGSGKSTTAHYIARQMEKNGIKVRWLYEQENDHPLLEIPMNKNESHEDYTQRVLVEYPRKWIEFVKKIKDDEYIYIVESYLFQDVIMFPHFMNDLENQKIKDFLHSILKIASCLNPIIIHFYQKDVDRSLRNNWKRRGDDWTKGFISFFGKTLYCKNRGFNDKNNYKINIYNHSGDLIEVLYKQYSAIKFTESEVDRMSNYLNRTGQISLDKKLINKKRAVLGVFVDRNNNLIVHPAVDITKGNTDGIALDFFRNNTYLNSAKLKTEEEYYQCDFTTFLNFFDKRMFLVDGTKKCSGCL